MIELKKSYVIEFTENQAQELYQLLRLQKDTGHLTTDHDIILVYNELRKLFDTGIR